MGAARPSSSVNFQDTTKDRPTTPGGDNKGTKEESEGAVKKGSAKKAASPKQTTPAASAKGQGLPTTLTLILTFNTNPNLTSPCLS